SLESVLLQIQRKSGYNFLLNADYLRAANRVTIDARDKDVDDVLKLILAQQPFDYQINGRIVSFTPKQGRKKDLVQTRQQRVVSGIVSDSTGTPLQGVTVLIEGTSRGTATDQSGRFELQVDENDVLLFRLVGYQSARIEVKQRDTVVVELQAEAADLEEVVVVGYGRMKRTNITGSVASLRMDEVENVP